MLHKQADALALTAALTHILTGLASLGGLLGLEGFWMQGIGPIRIG